MVFKPTPSRTQWESLIICGWIVIVDGLLLLWAYRRPVDTLKFFLLFVVMASLPLLLHLLIRTWQAFTLEYWVDRNAVTIRWANTRQVIPLDDIRRMVYGGLQDIARPARRHWPADHLRATQTLGLVDVRLMASEPLENCLLLETTGGLFAISPANQRLFVDAVQERYQMQPVRPVAMEELHATPFGYFFHRTRAGWLLLGIGFCGVLALIGMLMVRYPMLPDELVFGYTSDGLPLSIRGKSSLFLLPAIGLLSWLINGAWGLWMAARQEQTGAYMLWGGAIVVQVCSLLALISLIS